MSEKRKLEKFEIGCDIGNLMLMAAREIGNPGISIGFTVAREYLKRIAERSVELNDETLLYCCEKLHLITRKEGG